MENFNIKEWLPGIEAWMLQVFLIVLLTLIANLVKKLVLSKFLKFSKRSSTFLDDVAINSMQRPLTLLIWVIGIGFAASIIYQETEAPIFKDVEAIRDVGIIISLIWFLIRLARNLEDRYIKKNSIKPGPELTTAHAIGKLLRLSILITGALITLQTLGFSISGVLAFGGVSGIAVGFAARDLLANFFGAIMIYLDRPFVVGDWIRSPDREIEGTVEEISWRVTKIRTFEKRPLYVPNSVFTTIAVENPSRMSNRRIKEIIGVRYDDIKLLPKIIDDVKNMLEQHEEIDTSKTLMVNFDKFNDSSLDFFIYTFTKTTNWVRYHEIKQDVLLKISDIILSYNADIAYPTRTLHIPDNIQIEGNR